MIWLVNIFIYSFVFCFFFGQYGLLDKLSVRLDLRTLFTCFLTLSHDALALYSHSLTLSRCSRYLLALSHDALVICSRSFAFSRCSRYLLARSHDALALSLRNSRLTRRGRITIGNHSPHLTTLLTILSCIAAPRHWTKAAKPYSLWRNSQIFFL